ncbi:MAG: mechanosensitive ion channel domain-containing protein [Homoserinimonas sp.]
MDDTAPAFDWAGFWAGLASFAETWQGPIKVILIVIGALLLNWALRIAIRRVVDRVVTGAKKRHSVDDTQALIASPLAAARIVQRTRALGTVFNSAVTAVISIVVVLLLVSILFPNATGAFAIVSAAIGAGLGFGAQNIVKDVLNGIFMVAEDQLGVGDIADLGEATGTVEEVGLRITKVRSVDGTLWFVRNGEILRVGNFSHDWARVIIDLPTPYTADVATIQEKLLQTANTMANSIAWRSKILEKPEIWGIESVSAEALVIRLVMKTRPEEQWDVARELRLRLKLALDEINVNVPALNRVVIDSRATTQVNDDEVSSQTKPMPEAMRGESE